VIPSHRGNPTERPKRRILRLRRCRIAAFCSAIANNGTTCPALNRAGDELRRRLRIEGLAREQRSISGWWSG